MWSGNRSTTSVTVEIQESPLLAVTKMVRPWRSAGRVRVSPWKRAPQTPPLTLAGVHPGMGSGGVDATGGTGSTGCLREGAKSYAKRFALPVGRHLASGILRSG